LAEKYPGLVYAALGIHPWNVSVLKENELDETLKLISEKAEKKSVAAVGEIGLDAKYEKIWDKQLMVFDRMLRLAETLNLRYNPSREPPPYSRDASLIQPQTGLLHWFSYPLSALRSGFTYCTSLKRYQQHTLGIRG
jgi:Tat protein secretion system quality control protein TatD with DNase activity